MLRCRRAIGKTRSRVVNALVADAQLDAVKSQYACFFETLLTGPRAVVPAPQALDAPCPH